MSKAASMSHELFARDWSDECCHARCHLLGLFWAKVRRSGVCLLSTQSGEVLGSNALNLVRFHQIISTHGE